MRVYQLIRVSGGRPTATSGHRTARRKRLDDLERIIRMVSSAIPIITFRYYPYKKKKLTFWVSLFAFLAVRDSAVPGDDVHHESPVSTPEGAVTFPEPEVCDSFFEQIIHFVEAEGPPEQFIRGDILRAYPV